MFYIQYFYIVENNAWLDKTQHIVAFALQKLLGDGATILLPMCIAYFVNFSNPLEIKLKQKVKQNFSTAAVVLLCIMLQQYICIFPYDLLPHTISWT